jgi:hypothetical protein
LLFGYQADCYEYNNRFAISNCGMHYRERLSQMVYYLFFMSFHKQLNAARVLKYFDEIIDASGQKLYNLKQEHRSLFNDRFIHLWVGEFLYEMIEEEISFLQTLREKKDAITTYKEMISEPISFHLVDSFKRHCVEEKKRGVVELIHGLTSKLEDLKKDYEEIR